MELFTTLDAKAKLIVFGISEAVAVITSFLMVYKGHNDIVFITCAILAIALYIVNGLVPNVIRIISFLGGIAANIGGVFGAIFFWFPVLGWLFGAVIFRYAFWITAAMALLLLAVTVPAAGLPLCFLLGKLSA